MTSKHPKLRPNTVTLELPVAGELPCASTSVDESNVTARDRVCLWGHNVATTEVQWAPVALLSLMALPECQRVAVPVVPASTAGVDVASMNPAATIVTDTEPVAGMLTLATVTASGAFKSMEHIAACEDTAAPPTLTANAKE